jgi:acyl-CoA thioester hydrolase
VTAQTFRHQHRVTYAECTVGNHIYYARYLDLLEEARGEFFRKLDEPLLKWQEADTIFPVVECRLRYRGAARYDDLLTIELWIDELERVRLSFSYRIVNEKGAVILAAWTLHACSSLEDKLKRIPTELSDKLKPYVQGEKTE